MITKFKLTAILTSLVLALFFTSVAFGATGNEQIWTDKPDYAPGETVTISGSGFESILPVTIKITAPDTSVFTDDTTTEADGTLEYLYTLDPGMLGTYYVEAMEQATGEVLATTTFTDAPGAIWTTDGIAQNNHVFYTGGTAYINGEGLDPNATLNYDITDGPSGGAPVVKTGTVTTDATGMIIPVPANVWDIPINYQWTGNGQHKVIVYLLGGNQKSDNFSVTYGPWPPLFLTPATATNTIGTTHTVTVTANDINGNPVSGVKIYFSVTGANPNSGWASIAPPDSPGTTWSASTPTDANGMTAYTYTGNNTGTDTITATADSNINGIAEITEPSGTASKTWQSTEPT